MNPLPQPEAMGNPHSVCADMSIISPRHSHAGYYKSGLILITVRTVEDHNFWSTQLSVKNIVLFLTEPWANLIKKKLNTECYVITTETDSFHSNIFAFFLSKKVCKNIIWFFYFYFIFYQEEGWGMLWNPSVHKFFIWLFVIEKCVVC